MTSVRNQLSARHGGASDARLFAVVITRPNQTGRFYRLATYADLAAVQKAAKELELQRRSHDGDFTLTPEEPTPLGGGSGAGRAFSQRNYGMDRFEDLFTPRQLLALTTLVRQLRDTRRVMENDGAGEIGTVLQAILALIVDKMADSNSGQVWWMASGEKTVGTFTRQTIQIIWDFGEVPLTDAPSRSVGEATEWVARVIEHVSRLQAPPESGQALQADSTHLGLPNDFVSAFVSDPPYYDAVPYADLSDFFVVWLKRTLPEPLMGAFSTGLSPKADECILDEVKAKDRAYFERKIAQALGEGHRVLSPAGIGVIVFAHKTTAGWESMLQGLLAGGWVITRL